MADNFIVIKKFIDLEECEKINNYINNWDVKNEMISVDNNSLIAKQKFLTINGEDLERKIPAISKIEEKVFSLINLIYRNKLAPLENKVIGKSLNLTPPSGVLSWHYDRNLVTAIIYLNEINGGELEVYPNYRIRINNNHIGIIKLIQKFFDAILRPKFIRLVLGNKVKYQPETGSLVIIDSTCLHQVSAVREGPKRLALVLCYDYLGKKFDINNTRNYYGYKGKKAQLYR